MEPIALRSCKAGGRSLFDKRFQWNMEIGGITTAPDWEPTKECGNGLHGFLFGEGDGDLACWDDDAVWMLVRPIGEIVDLGRKVKFESAETLFVGDRESVTAHLAALCPLRAIIGGTATAGDGGTATAGDGGTATAGDGGTATAGDGGTATAGDGGTATAGDGGTATAGYGGIITLRYWDDDTKQYRFKTGYVGEDGVKASTAYRLNNQHEFEEVKGE